jgi:MFS family permease
MFAVYGMTLVITQYMQNVRGFSPTDAGLLLLPYSMSLMSVSLAAGRLVGLLGSRALILLGLALLIVGFAVLIGGLQATTVIVGIGLFFVGVGVGLCLTPITSLAMTTVPTARAGMASGIMSAQRALGSTVGFAVLGSILAATLTVTLSTHLAGALPDPTERKEVADMIIGNANPRAYSAEIGPGRPIKHLNADTQKAILAVADSDFIEGIRFSLATAIVFLTLVLAAGIAWFPRRNGSITDAEREARALASEETARGSRRS